MPFNLSVALMQIKYMIRCKLHISTNSNCTKKLSFTFYNCIKGKLCDSCIILYTSQIRLCLIEIDYAIIDRMSIIKFR